MARCTGCDKPVPYAAQFENPPFCSTKCAKGHYGTVYPVRSDPTQKYADAARERDLAIAIARKSRNGA